MVAASTSASSVWPRGGRAAASLSASQPGVAAAACSLPARRLVGPCVPCVGMGHWNRPIVTAAPRLVAATLASASSSSSEPRPPVTPPPSSASSTRPAPQTCPACGQICSKAGVFERHLGACCPDLVPRAAWRAAVAEGREAEVLAAASAVEAALRDDAVRLAFRTTDPATGDPVRRSAAEVAAVLGLPIPRVAASLKAAMRAVPLAADADPVHVIFEDAHLIAFAKPAGLITAPKHRYTGGSLVNRAIAHLGGVPPYPVHRLDMFTSGVVVMGKTGGAAAALHAQFRERTAVKRYLALVVGRVGEGEGAGAGRDSSVVVRSPSFPPGAFAVAAPIGRHPGHEVARAALGPADPDGAPSLTLFRPVAVSEALGGESGIGGGGGGGASTSPVAGAQPAPLAPAGTLASLARGATLLCAAPRTGRTHQIRVHATAAGHPLVGDDLYGALLPWAPRQLLHAATLDLVHPATGAHLSLAAPLPDDFLAALGVVGLSVPADLPAHLPAMDGWGPDPPC